MKESSYRVRQIMSATLSFNTYNYINMLQDSTPGTLGGDAGKGLGSDVEYEYIKTAGDTLFLRGRKFKKDLMLIKATNVQQQQYIDGEYATAIDKVTYFFEQNANPYIEIGNIKYQISINEARKNTDAAGVLPGNAIVTTADKFYFTLDGIKIVGGMAVGDEVFVAYQWIEGRLYAISGQGTPYEIKNSTAPILPLHLLMGTKYSGLRSSHAVEFPGSSADGLAILRRYHQGLGNGAAGYIFKGISKNLLFSFANPLLCRFERVSPAKFRVFRDVHKFIMKINAIFFIPSTIPLPPEGGTMVDGHADVWGTMVSPSGVRGALAKGIVINIWKNL